MLNRPKRTAISHSEQKPSAKNISSKSKCDDHDKVIDKFTVNYDDSSDEEEVINTLAEYTHRSIDLSVKKKVWIKSDKLLSLTAHTAGVKLLYSEAVNHLYYPLKKKLLWKNSEKDSSEQLTQIVEKSILDSTRKSLDAIKRFLLLTKQKTYSPSKIESISENIYKDFSAQVNTSVAAHLSIIIRWLKFNKFTYKDKCSDEMTAFEAELTNIFLKIVNNHFKIGLSAQDRENLKEKIFQSVENEINALIKKYKFDKKANMEGKIDALKQLKEYEGNYPHMIAKIRLFLKKSDARGYVKSMLEAKLKEKANKSELIYAYLEDLIELSSSKGKKKWTSAEAGLYQQYFVLNNDSLTDEASYAFSHFISLTLRSDIRSFMRPVLDQHYKFISDSPSSFFANLRLSNRSQKREMANLNRAHHKTTHVARLWQFSTSTAHNTDVYETQGITYSKSQHYFGRKDLVVNLGSYAKVYDEMEEVKDYLRASIDKLQELDLSTGITDCVIAKLIRSIFIGKPLLPVKDIDPTILRKLNEITYLLFGCEAARNPAMIIINNMLLDLIMENEDWTFEEVFMGTKDHEELDHARLMPMVPDGAVAAARIMQNVYRKHLPYPYYYPGIGMHDHDEGSSSDRPDLTQLEAQIIRAWLTHKKYLTAPERPDLINWLQSIIESQYARWFGASFTSTKTIRKKTNGL